MTDYAHRSGQTRDVNIHKLTIENTVEERILALQEERQLALSFEGKIFIETRPKTPGPLLRSLYIQLI
jgi:hypothetical protein